MIEVAAQPGARRDGIVGVRGDALRIAVAAVPERGRANQSILELLADAIGCRRSELRILVGAGHRTKQVLLIGRDPDEVRARLERHLSPKTE